MNSYKTTIPIEQPTLSKIDFFLVFWLICISGNPLFGELGGKYIYLGTTIGAAAISVYYAKPLYSLKLIMFILASVVLFLLQSTILTSFSVLANANFIARLYSGFLITSFLGYKFRYAYMKVIFFVSVVSLVFWLINAFVDFPGIEIGQYRSIVVFNYILKTDIYSFTGRRNSGMFWEPGAFQGFIMLVPIMYIGQIRELLRQFRKECIILFLALLSTMSTTGYVVFAVLVLLVIVKNIQNVFFKFVLAFSMAAIFMWAYNTLDFLGEKVEKQYDDALELGRGEVSWSRMGALQIDLENVKRHPIIGNGFLQDSRYGILGDKMRGAGNGFTGALNSMGIPFIIFYFFLLFKNAPAVTRYESMIVPIIILLLLNGEAFLNHPLFWSLIFVKYPDLSSSELYDDICAEIQTDGDILVAN
jgi:hypothetical protein